LYLHPYHPIFYDLPFSLRFGNPRPPRGFFALRRSQSFWPDSRYLARTGAGERVRLSESAANTANSKGQPFRCSHQVIDLQADAKMTPKTEVNFLNSDISPNLSLSTYILKRHNFVRLCGIQTVSQVWRAIWALSFLARDPRCRDDFQTRRYSRICNSRAQAKLEIAQSPRLPELTNESLVGLQG
jgi:hypothetical protein